MRRTLFPLALGVMLAGLPGCGTLPTEKNVPSSYRQTLDTEVMAAVESKAQASGTEVYWINPPRKRKD